MRDKPITITHTYPLYGGGEVRIKNVPAFDIEVEDGEYPVAYDMDVALRLDDLVEPYSWLESGSVVHLDYLAKGSSHRGADVPPISSSTEATALLHTANRIYKNNESGDKEKRNAANIFRDVADWLEKGEV